jgi:hypothetical protein
MFESKINRGRANGYAPLDGSGKVPLEKLPPIQSTINTGSFATTGSNTFTGNQIISGSGDSSLTIGEGNTIAGPSFGLRVSGSDGAPLFLTSDGTLLIGAITNPTDLSDDASFFANQLISFPISDGPTAGILVQKSGSFQSNWVFDYDGKSYFPSDINIGYNSLGSGLTSGSLNITKGNINVSGSLYFGSGSVISETSSSTIITPPGATYGQSLVIRQTAMVNLYSDHPLGFYLGDTITLTFQPDGNGAVSGSAPYLFTGCTESQLGTSLSGSLEFDNEVTKSLTWTIPELSDITGFTFDIYNFQYDATQSISLSSSGSSEHSHIHLVSGNPSLVDIYLGDDDQYVKIEKNAGDVVIGTNLDTHHWRFDTSGSLTTPGSVIVGGSLIQQVNYAPLGSGSFEETPATEVTELDITKDIHLIDITDIEGNSHYYLPNGLYDGQVVRLALKGDNIASPNNVYVWVESLRTDTGAGTQFVDWLPFFNDTARSLATAVYIDGSWNIDNSHFGMW